jgi:hypothetical protein
LKGETASEILSLPNPGKVVTIPQNPTRDVGRKEVKLARLDLIPAKPLWLLSEVYGRGARKYDDRNWEKGIEFSKLYGALQRHLLLWWTGEEIDPEDGQHHLASVAWHAFALLELGETHPELDDRPRKVNLESEKIE